MKSRIFKFAGIIFLIPLVTVMAFSHFWEDGSMRISALALGTLIEIFMITLCKKNLRNFFKPVINIADGMGIKRTPTPYEPGKFNRDFSFANIGIYLVLLSPLAAYMAKLNPTTTEITTLNFAKVTSPNFDLLVTSFALLAAGTLSMAIWAKLGQAVAITNEIGENKRYLYMGFAEEIDNNDTFFSYRMLSMKK